MYYYNTENNEGCWEKPEDFINSSLLTREEIQVSSTCSTRSPIIIPACFNYCLTFMLLQLVVILPRYYIYYDYLSIA